MSETSNGMPDLTAGDNEPSMEDILSSIRKIIADDKSDETLLAENYDDTVQDEAPVQQAETQIPAEIQTESELEQLEEAEFESLQIPEIEESPAISDESIDLTDAVIESEPETSSDEDDILDLINFAEDEEFEQVASGAPELGAAALLSDDNETDSLETALEGDEDVAFDESLDLVMDADASDYLKADTESNDPSENAEMLENQLLRDEIASEFNDDEDADDADDEAEAFWSQSEDADVQAEDSDEIDDLTSEDIWGQSSEEEAVEETSETEEVEELEEVEEVEAVEAEDDDDLESEFNREIDANSFIETDDVSATSSDDDDIDLVKSLLADLMDEPEAADDGQEFVEEEAENVETIEGNVDAAEADSILDEILYQSIGDEETISEQGDSSIVGDESELALIAREAREAAESSASDIQAQDKDAVVLGGREISGQLSLTTKIGAAAIAASGADIGAKQLSESDEEDLEALIGEDNLDELMEEIVEDEVLEAIEDQELNVLEADTEIDETDQQPEEIEHTQEEEPMVRAAKKEALLDDEVEQDSSEAFASLTSVVKEKADLEESGPPIGDLVQEALRPMLKEWLDKNLKGIVERAVTKEVKRISSGK